MKTRSASEPYPGRCDDRCDSLWNVRVASVYLATTFLLTVTFLLVGITCKAAAQSPSARTDPGFPYVDVNHDGIFDPADGDIGKETGVDILKILKTRGTFDTSAPIGDYVPPPAPASLVVPRSVRLRSGTLDFLELTAGANLSFLGKADIGKGFISFSASRRLVADGSFLIARGDIDLSAGVDTGSDTDGGLSAVSAKVRSTEGVVALSALNEISIHSIDVRALDGVEISNEDGIIDVGGANLTSKNGNIDIESDFAYDGFSEAGAVSVGLNGAKLNAVSVSVETLGASILAEDARVDASAHDENNEILFDSAGGLIAMDRVRMTGAGSIDIMTWAEPENPIQASRIEANGAKLRSRSDAVDFDAGGCGGSGAGRAEIIAQDMSLVAENDADLHVTSHSDSGFIDVQRAQLIVNEGDLKVRILDDEPESHESIIDARGVRVSDPILPTFFAEIVLGDPTPILPDLVFAADGLLPTRLSDSQLQVHWKIANQGAGEAPAGTQILFFWSEDTAIDAGDTVLGRLTVATALPARAGRAEGSAEFTVSAGGERFFVIGVLDPDDDLKELNEDNNRAATRLPLPELFFGGGYRVSLVSATDAQVDWTVRNGGELGAPAGVAVDFFYSHDRTLDSSDVLLRTVTLADPLPIGGSVGGAEVFTVFPPEALFFIIGVIDSNDDVLEQFEDNNQAVGGVGPDLTIERLIARYSQSERKFLIDVTIGNEGQLAATGTIETTFGLIRLPNPEIISIGSLTFSDLAAGGSHSQILEFPFDEPPPSSSSFWFLTAKTDAAEVIGETDEENNGTLVNVFFIP